MREIYCQILLILHHSLSLSRQSRQQKSLLLLHESASFSLSLAAVSEPRRQRTSCFQKKKKLKVTWVPYPSEEAYFREIRAVGEKSSFLPPSSSPPINVREEEKILEPFSQEERQKEQHFLGR